MQERILTDKLLKLFPGIQDYYFSEGNICWDCFINMKNGWRILSEVKVRDYEKSDFPDYILEVQKLVNLMKKKKQNGYDKIYYINFFNKTLDEQKDFIIFDLTPRIEQWKIIKPVVKKMYMNAATFISNTNKVQKEVIMLVYDEKIDMTGTINLN